MRCNRCYRPMLGTTAYDGACACFGLIEADPLEARSERFADAVEEAERNYGTER